MEVVPYPDQDISEFIQVMPQLIMWSFILVVAMMWYDEQQKN